MEHEEQYEDLTTLFEAQDDALQSEAFVARVMSPIKQKRSRWRTPLLFGAGGIGVGAALSQIGGVLDLLKARAPELDVTFDTMPSAQIGLETPSLWVIATVVIIVACAAIVAAERA
nr:hypothetical protein [Hyphomonas sp. Mor2]